MTAPDLRSAVEATHEAAQLLRARRVALRDAVLSGDPDEVVRCARILLGMDEDDGAQSDRPDPR